MMCDEKEANDDDLGGLQLGAGLLMNKTRIQRTRGRMTWFVDNISLARFLLSTTRINLI